MSFVEVLRRFVPKLEKNDIPYMITGSIAASYYGLTRATQDLDMVISATQAKLRGLIQSLPKEEYYADLGDALDGLRHLSMFNVLDTITGWKIDLIFQKPSSYHEGAFQRRRPATFEGVPTSMIGLEDLILSKLEWSKLGESERQIRDAAVVLQKRSRDVDRPYIEKWVKELALDSQWEKARSAADIQ